MRVVGIFCSYVRACETKHPFIAIMPLYSKKKGRIFNIKAILSPKAGVVDTRLSIVSEELVYDFTTAVF